MILQVQLIIEGGELKNKGTATNQNTGDLTIKTNGTLTNDLPVVHLLILASVHNIKSMVQLVNT